MFVRTSELVVSTFYLYLVCYTTNLLRNLSTLQAYVQSSCAHHCSLHLSSGTHRTLFPVTDITITMPKSIQDLEREVLILEQQKISIEIRIWNAKDNLLRAQTSQGRTSDNDNDPPTSGASLQDQRQTATAPQGNVRMTQASGQGQENDNSRPADSHSTRQQRTVSPLGSLEPGSRDSHDTFVNNQRLLPDSVHLGQISVSTNQPEPSTSIPQKQLSVSSKPVPFTAQQINAEYARLGLVPPPSRPSTALSDVRSQQMPPPQIRSPFLEQEAVFSPQEAPQLEQGQIAALKPSQGPTHNNPLQYGRPNGAASSPRLPKMPPKQYDGLFPNDTSAGTLETLLQPGRNTAQGPPTLTHNELQNSRSTFDPQTQQRSLTDVFSFYEAQGIQQDHTSQHAYTSSETDQRLPSATGTVPRLGRGLTKKYKDAASPSPLNKSSDSATRTNNPLQRKRTPSVEVTEQRPRQRLRSEDSRVLTPPLNENDGIKSEDGIMSDSDVFNSIVPAEHGQQTIPDIIYEFNATPPLTRPQGSRYPEREPSNSNTSQRALQKWERATSHIYRHQQPSIAGRSADYLKNGGRQINEHYSEEEEDTSQDLQQRPRKRRQATGTPALIAEATKDTPGINHVAPRSARPRKPQGSYKTPEYKPLSPAERHDLEKRFCCQVAKIIGSKICVNKPPMPFDNVRIFDRLRERLLGKGFGGGEEGDEGRSKSPFTPCWLELIDVIDTPTDEGFTADSTEKYRTATDFQNDARRMLQDYVKLGHCEGCPFEVTGMFYLLSCALSFSAFGSQLTDLGPGNARVMCYRMRLTSILDARMREIKQCIYECEIDFDASDWEGRRKRVDTWFSDEDFQEAGHDATR